MSSTWRVSPGLTHKPKLDWLLLISVGSLLVIGVLMVWSVSRHHPSLAGAATKQMWNCLVAIVLAMVVMMVDYRRLRVAAPVLYLAALFGLVLVLLIGTVINGAKSWIILGGASLQPAEFTKLAVITLLALFAAERVENKIRNSFRHLLVLLVVVALPAVLILLQPDLGTLIILLGAVFVVLGISGVDTKYLLALLLTGGVVALAASYLGVLKPYQLNRFLAFTDPALDPLGAGYNTIQARIAIGNGGFWGQGILAGTQTKAGFVPEQQTDFIFTAIGEELGFWGVCLVIGLLGVVVWRAIQTAFLAKDMFGKVAAAGIAAWFGLQSFQNIGMCLGIMPVTGVPLPFLSYGGSALFATLMAVGLLLNIQLNQRQQLKYL